MCTNSNPKYQGFFHTQVRSYPLTRFLSLGTDKPLALISSSFPKNDLQPTEVGQCLPYLSLPGLFRLDCCCRLRSRESGSFLLRVIGSLWSYCFGSVERLFSPCLGHHPFSPTKQSCSSSTATQPSTTPIPPVCLPIPIPLAPAAVKAWPISASTTPCHTVCPKAKTPRPSKSRAPRPRKS